MRNSMVTMMVLAVVCLFGGASKGHAEWGAIAIDSNVMAYGMSYGHRSKSQAKRDALRTCRNHGSSSCEIKTYFSECGAVAADAGANGWGVGTGRDINRAGRRAVRNCSQYTGGCQVQAARCNNSSESDEDDDDDCFMLDGERVCE